MPLVLLFLFGAINFATHKAVLESGHRLVRRVPAVMRAHGGRLSLLLEYLLLLCAMLTAAAGSQGAVWVYAIYTACNAILGWLVLGRRI